MANSNKNLCVKSTSGLFINYKGEKPQPGTEVYLKFMEKQKALKSSGYFATFINNYDIGTLWVFTDTESINSSGSLFKDKNGTLWLKLVVDENTSAPAGRLTKATM